MIRLNDINKTVISETKIKCYGSLNDYTYDNGVRVDREAINVLFTLGEIICHYESKELRDNDIELLDKIFDVKSIEYKAMSVAKPELYSNEGGINEESKPVKEEYITWDYVKQYATSIKAEFPNGDIRTVYYKEEAIYFTSAFGDDWDCAVYDEYLFNSLKLKKVE